MAGKRIKVVHAAPHRLSAELQKLGFTDYEARVYIRLLQESPATAYELSKNTSVPRSNAYSALDALAQRGVVQPVSEDPVRYVAIPPEVVFDRIAKSTRQLCDDLADELGSMRKPEDEQFVWVLRDEKLVHEKIANMIDGARQHIWIKAADEILRRHKAELAAAAKRGTEILAVMFGKDADEFRFSGKTRVFLHEGNGVRMGTADNHFTVVVDHGEVMMANVEAEVFAAHTQNVSIVTMAESLIRHEYYLAEIFTRLPKEMTRAFGPHLFELRATCFTAEQLAAYKQRMGLA